MTQRQKMAANAAFATHAPGNPCLTMKRNYGEDDSIAAGTGVAISDEMGSVGLRYSGTTDD